MIINLDPDEDDENEDSGTPKIAKTMKEPSTPINHVGSTPAQTPTTPNHLDSSNVSCESPEYQKQVSYTKKFSKCVSYCS